jgi:hypothetical protein
MYLDIEQMKAGGRQHQGQVHKEVRLVGHVWAVCYAGNDSSTSQEFTLRQHYQC